jgi:hypothetical protein
MCRLGITISIWGGGRNPIDGSEVQVDIVISANHLYDVLTKSQSLSFHALIDRELVASLSIKPLAEQMSINSDKAKFDETAKFLAEISIPFEPIMHYPGGIVDNGTVSGYDLYDIFSDKEKLQVLSSKLKDKKCGNIL